MTQTLILNAKSLPYAADLCLENCLHSLLKNTAQFFFICAKFIGPLPPNLPDQNRLRLEINLESVYKMMLKFIISFLDCPPPPPWVQWVIPQVGQCTHV